MNKAQRELRKKEIAWVKERLVIPPKRPKEKRRIGLTKKYNYSKHPDAIVPHGDVGALLKPNNLSDTFRSMNTRRRSRLVAFLHSFYTAPEIASMLNLTPAYVRQCSVDNRDILEAARLGRNFAIADMSERRVVELLQKMDVDNIPDDKKAASIKHLMDSAGTARTQAQEPSEHKDENVTELIFSIKKKMRVTEYKRKTDESDDDTDDDDPQPAIDINSEVKELNP
jgi:hypothetical protein